MNNRFIITCVATFISVTSLAVNNGYATNEYDVQAFGPKNPIIWDTPVKVEFSHRVHTEDAGLECSSCHGEPFAMQRGVAMRSGKLTMTSLAEGKYCGMCHDGDTAFASDTNCAGCHTPPEERIVWSKPVKAVVFHHQLHTDEYGLECDSCHNEVFAMKSGTAEQSPFFTMKSLYKGQYCGKCHDGETAFASNTLCNTCHIGKKGYNRLMGNASHSQENNKEKSGH